MFNPWEHSERIQGYRLVSIQPGYFTRDLPHTAHEIGTDCDDDGTSKHSIQLLLPNNADSLLILNKESELIFARTHKDCVSTVSPSCLPACCQYFTTTVIIDDYQLVMWRGYV